MISVVIPVYNAALTIGRCLDSIIGGEYQDIEILVINDGSTDNTEELVNEYIRKDSRISIINQENHGCGYAKSVGIRSCKGEYIAFCDADDWYDSNYLSEHHKYLIKYNADISQSKTWLTSSRYSGNTDHIQVIEDDLLERYIEYRGVNVTLWDKLFRREVLDVAEIENDLRSADDLFMNYVAAKRAKRVILFETTKYNWFCNPNSLSRGRFNPERLENDFKSWRRIIDGCAQYSPELEEKARLSSELWICGTFRSMVDSHYHNKELENRIAEYIRQDGIKKTLAAEKNKTNKRFIRLALISLPLARYTRYVLVSGKRMIKKLMRQ